MATPTRTDLPLPAAPANDGRTTDVPLLVRFTAFAVFVFPSSMVIEPIGAAGTLPMMLACLLFAFWLCSFVWGLHRPVTRRHPGRLAISAFLLSVLASYLAMYAGWTGPVSEAGYAAADRWLILIMASFGLILVIAECARSMEKVMQLSRWILAGAFFSCLVAVVQFLFRVNPMEWMQMAMVGFVYNGGDTAFQVRGSLVRPAGTTFTSIELAVVMAMLIPLSIWRAMHDLRGRRWFHWLQTALLVFSVVATVSRSGVLAIAVGLLVFLPFTPPRFRRRVLIVLPFLVVAIFIAVPGVLSTLGGALTADVSDPSISTRVNNYPRVTRMIDLHPIFGVGPGTYLPENALQILDNQYLNTAVTTGVVGLIGLVVYLMFPAITAIHTARHAQTEQLRGLAGALAAALSIAAVCSGTFDSLSFPVFALCYPLLVGLAGAVWQIVRESGPSAFHPYPPIHPHPRRGRDSRWTL